MTDTIHRLEVEVPLAHRLHSVALADAVSILTQRASAAGMVISTDPKAEVVELNGDRARSDVADPWAVVLHVSCMARLTDGTRAGITAERPSLVSD